MNERELFQLKCPEERCGALVEFVSERSKRWLAHKGWEPELGKHPSPVTVQCRRCKCAIRVEITEAAGGEVHAVITGAQRHG